jgi:hypothetical protein
VVCCRSARVAWLERPPSAGGAAAAAQAAPLSQRDSGVRPRSARRSIGSGGHAPAHAARGLLLPR